MLCHCETLTAASVKSSGDEPTLNLLPGAVQCNSCSFGALIARLRDLFQSMRKVVW